jgi:hypothetical protein
MKHMKSSIVYSVNCEGCERICVWKTDRQAIQRMKEQGAWSTTCEQQATVDRDTVEDKLIESSRIRNKNTDLSKLPNYDDNSDDKKVVYSALSKYEKASKHRINWKDVRVVWRDENPYRLLIKESSLIQAYKPELKRTTHSVPWIVFSDGLAVDSHSDPNG